MIQGLLFKEAPEPRFELYCDFSLGVGKGKCNILFDSIIDYNAHLKEVHQGWFGLKELPLRPQRRFNVTKKMLDNMGGRTPGTKKCWCGKPKDQWDSRHFQTYCSDVHRNLWWTLTDYVGPHKNKYLEKNNKCTSCGYIGKRSWNTSDLEMDHIIAIILGGHPWDYRNLQSLCKECHKIKTKSDVGILAEYKRQAKYDIGPIIPDPQTTLDNSMEFNYAYN